MITLQQKLKEYIENKSIELLSLIYHKKVDTLTTPKTVPETSGYSKHKNVIDLGEIVGSMDFTVETLDEKTAKRIRKYNDEDVGYEEKGFLEIYKLVNSILKDNNVAATISEKFLVHTIFEWLVATYRKEIDNISLSDFIIRECIKCIEEVKIYIPILNLESDKDFVIGNVHFQYLSEDYIRILSKSVVEEKRNDYISAMLMYKGQLMGACIVKAEQDKAIELACKYTAFSIDILRMASPTIEMPSFRIYYDVDFRNIHQTKNDIIVQPIKEAHNFTNQFRRRSRPFEIIQRVWEYMDEHQLGLLSNFSLQTLYNQTELEQLIRNGIKNFSSAIANHDYHERITKVFTVLESLLLPNDSSPIIDSVCKYLPKLITKNSSDREKIVSVVKEMYAVRSAMIHHAKKKDFDIENLAIIQKCTKALIIRFIELSRSKQTKSEILKEIDDAINRA
jgi:hypothetical protein